MPSDTSLPAVLCLTTCHFVFTSVMLECWKRLGIFQPVNLPNKDVQKLALGAFGSIATMNLSLAANSIGVYQVPHVTRATQWVGARWLTRNGCLCRWASCRAFPIWCSTSPRSSG